MDMPSSNIMKITAKCLSNQPYQHTAGGEGGGTPDTERTFVCPSPRSANKEESASWMIFLSAALQLLRAALPNLCAVKLKGQATAADGATKNHHQE